MHLLWKVNAREFKEKTIPEVTACTLCLEAEVPEGK